MVCVCVFCGVRNVAARAFSLRCGYISVFSLFIPTILPEIQLTIEGSQFSASTLYLKSVCVCVALVVMNAARCVFGVSDKASHL